MTTRPNLGGPQRQPQRSLSANITQRPPPNRTLSQQYPPASPARRGNESFADLTFDGSDASLGRYGTIPRNGGSRLKLEISKDSKNPTFVESPKPTSEPTPSWRPSMPPRGRPQLHFDVPSVSNLSPRTAQEVGNNEVIIKPMPLPVRPGQHAPPHLDKMRVAPGNAAKKDARPKPYVLEVPTSAPHYSVNGHADFFPWTGNHLEDQFSETAIRSGFFDKSQMTQNETASAKPSIFPGLKHKSGLQTLSSLFTSVLAQRRAHGQITSTSTFKPPPRVTVTDTKREMWLKDLANPTISLRRLSRSIPHGIRGKVLLDQSLSKNIPIERAVWLAKCVGANELRSFRRKGVSGTFAMGGEAKWIRDFTVCVEQFVESIVSSCGENDFKSRINYGIRLAAHFHAEHLLDREHYMDWLVSALENSPQAKLPLWLLITQIYWKDLLQYRKFGRRLAAALMNQMAETINHPDNDILAPLSDRLKTLVKGLIISNPESFVSPKVWTKHRTTLQSSLTPDDPHLAAIFATLDLRNARVTTASAEKASSSRRLIIELLDMTLSKPIIPDLLRDCWKTDSNRPVLLQTVLEWSTSSFRPGFAKIYVAARVLRQWSRLGADITEAILSFLDSGVCEKGRHKSSLYHLVSELARSEHFSVPLYLQWIIARGGIYQTADIARDGPCATRLLAEIPIHNLSEGMIALRTTLLDRVNFSVDNEEHQTIAHKNCLNKSLPGMQANIDDQFDTDHYVAEDFTANFSGLSRTSKAEVGLWLRQKVRLQMLQPTIPPLDDWDDSPMKGGTSAITSSEFNIVRQSLELMEDYSMLADVLKIVTSSNDPEVLASCADTLNLHQDTFAAVGALDELFEVLMTRLRSLTEDDTFPRVLLVSLSDLAARIPEQNIIAQQLAQELVRSDRKTAADACSPVSDHMAGVQTEEIDFTDEIEKFLASGNSMDQATLERLFQRIAQRLEESWGKSPEQQRSCGLLFTRLKTFDTQQFDVLMSAWITRFLQMDSRPSLGQVFGPLISLGCLSLGVVISKYTLRTLNEASMDRHRIVLEMLALFTSPPTISDIMTVEEIYRLRIKQSNLQREQPSAVLQIMRGVFEHASFDDVDSGGDQFDAKGLFKSHSMYELLQALVLVDVNSIVQILIMPLLQSAQSGVAFAISSVVDKLLTPNDTNEGTQQIPIEMVLDLADDFTLPFCQVKFALVFNKYRSGNTGSQDESLQQLEALDRAIDSAIAAANTTWTCIIPLLDNSVTQHLRNRAETQFLGLFPSLKTIGDDSWTSMKVIDQAERLLYIVGATARSNSNLPSISSTASEMVAAINSTWILLSSTQIQDWAMKETVLTKWLPLLLSFITLNTSAFEATKSGHETRAKALLGLAAILLKLQAWDTSIETPVGALAKLTEQTFDLALQLVDPLPDDLRQQCIRALRDTTTNSRISYLFSVAANPSEWLVLSQKEKVGVAAGPEGRGQIEKEKLTPYPLRRWEMLGEPTPNIGENDTSLSLALFGARRG